METEKANSIQSFNLLSAIPKTFRILEIIVAVMVLSWTLTRLPSALTVSAGFLSCLAASPLFIFAISNAIIAALIAQSGRFSAQTAADDAAAGLYREFLNSRNSVPDPPSPADAPECQDKEVIISETVPDTNAGVGSDVVSYRRSESKEEVITETVQDSAVADAGVGSDVVSYRRSQSEKWKGAARRKELRRSETEKQRENGGDEILYPQDELSNEEFQRTIDAFIAKQMRFLREESSAIVVQKPC